MTATHPTFRLMAGDTWQLDAALHDEQNAPLNLAGVTAIDWRLRNAGNRLLAALSLGAGVTVLDAAKGTCRIVYPAASSVEIAAGIYYDEIRVILASGFVTTQAVGQIAVERAGAPAATVLPASAGFTNADWSAINDAIATGALTVHIKDRTVTYRSLTEMKEIRSMIARELGLSTPAGTVLLAHKDGRGSVRRGFAGPFE